MALVDIQIQSDVLGLSKPSTALIKAIGHGVGAVYSFATSRWRNGVAVSNARDWARLYSELGIDIASSSLTLEQRAGAFAKIEAVKSQFNREEIAFHAVEDQKAIASEIGGDAPAEIDLDWLDRFWDMAGKISDGDRQRLWGRVLSRKTAGKNAVSGRTLHFLSTIDLNEGSAIRDIAACAYRIDAATGKRESGILVELSPYTYDGKTAGSGGAFIIDGCPDQHMDIFGPAGLWVQSGWAHPIAVAKHKSARIHIGNKQFVIRRSAGHFFPEEANYSYAYLGHGTQLSTLGMEVVELIDEPPSSIYIASLQEQLKRVGGELDQL